MSVAKSIGNLIRREPAVLLSLAGAGVGLATQLGLHLNVAQTRAVYGFVAMVTGFFIRQTVTPTSTLTARLDALEASLKELQVPAAVTGVVQAAADATQVKA